MGDLTATQMVTELQRRITQLSAPDALAAVNRAIRWINRQGSFTFQLNTPQSWSVTSTAVYNIPSDMDIGKAHLLLNPNGTPIRKIGVHDAWVSKNYNIPPDKGFDTYHLTQTTVNFGPAQSGTTTVTAHYHLKTANISGSTAANLPRDFDDLIIDLAEAEERRIMDVGEIWPQVLARCQDQIKTMLDGYRSVSMEPMPTTEAAGAVQEKTQIGRA